MPGLRWAQGGRRWEEGDRVGGPSTEPGWPSPLSITRVTSQEGYPVGCRLIGEAGTGGKALWLEGRLWSPVKSLLGGKPASASRPLSHPGDKYWR